MKRHQQGWLVEVTGDIDELVVMIRQARKDKAVTSIGYHGNIVDVW